MASKRVSIYIPEHLAGVLDLPEKTEADGGMSQRIAAILDRYGLVVARSCPTLSRPEWMLLLDACNGWASWAEAGETLMAGFAAEVADGIALNDLATKWGLSEKEGKGLVGKLAALDAPQTIAVLERVERFWRRHAMGTDEAMAAAGIVTEEDIER